MSTDRLRIKICGITRLQDAELAASLGAWALGFVFHEKSPRATRPENVREILKALHGRGTLKSVGVFVNAGIERISDVVRISGIHTVQLHGEETPAFCEELRKAIPEVSLLKALRPRNREDLKQIPKFAPHCEGILLDTYVEGNPGGTGVRGDWSLAVQAKAYGPIILAGGLGPGNVQAALEQVEPQGVDASSGLEESPGVKSAEKLRKFFENAAEVRGRNPGNG